jgi:hypothetical protein
LKKSKREGPEAFVDLSDDKFVQNDKLLDTSLNPPDPNANPIPSRSVVLQACIITSGLIAAFGTVIRQVIFLLCIAESVFPFVVFFQLCCIVYFIDISMPAKEIYVSSSHHRN